jgi:hypothetical protein
MLPNPASARNAGDDAHTATASCTAAMVVTPGASYTPGTNSHGSFTASISAPCAGLNFSYNMTQVSMVQYNAVTGAFQSGGYQDCFGSSSCSKTFSFTGGPSHFSISGFAAWNSTSGPWLYATPGVVVSSAPFCYGWPGPWPVTPLTPAFPTVGCNLVFDLVM